MALARPAETGYRGGMWWLIPTALAGQTAFGLQWHPLARADVSWVDDGRTTGLAVGEMDGVVRPSLSAFFGGWISERFGLFGHLGIARLQNTTWVGDVWEQRHWGVFRPGLDARFALLKPRTDSRRMPHPWVLGGLYGDIPSVRETSNGYDDVEQDVADDAAASDRARLAGFGGRLGFGADLQVVPGLTVGAQYTLGVHQGLFLGDDADVVSSWVASEAALLLTFWWGGAEPGTPPAP